MNEASELPTCPVCHERKMRPLGYVKTRGRPDLKGKDVPHYRAGETKCDNDERGHIEHTVRVF